MCDHLWQLLYNHLFTIHWLLAVMREHFFMILVILKRVSSKCFIGTTYLAMFFVCSNIESNNITWPSRSVYVSFNYLYWFFLQCAYIYSFINSINFHLIFLYQKSFLIFVSRKTLDIRVFYYIYVRLSYVRYWYHKNIKNSFRNWFDIRALNLLLRSLCLDYQGNIPSIFFRNSAVDRNFRKLSYTCIHSGYSYTVSMVSQQFPVWRGFIIMFL